MNLRKKNDIMIIAKKLCYIANKMITTIKTFEAIVLRQTDKTIYN